MIAARGGVPAAGGAPVPPPAAPRGTAGRAARPRLLTSLCPVLVALAAGVPGPVSGATALEAAADSVRIRWEIGGSTDVTNEQFYEDAYIDTVSLGRRLVASPETRVAGVLAAALEGTRSSGATRYRLRSDLSLGNRIQREALRGSWRQRLGPDWDLALVPHGEFRHDRTFDRDLDEWRAGGDARLRRAFADRSAFAELGASGDLLRTRGRGDAFLLDRNAGRVSVAFDHLGITGADWRAGWALAARVFPDSSVRDHFEQSAELQWRRDLAGLHWIELDAEGVRRRTMAPAPTSRDEFWQGQAGLGGALELGDRWSLRLRAEGEAIRYDVQDSTLYFDYQILRLRLGPRFESLRGWSVTVGPRAEWLASRLSPGDRYQEIAGAAELEILGRASWWSVEPMAGWRDYDSTPNPPGEPAIDLHTSYAFVGLDLLADQSLPGGLRLRLLASGRLESHTDPLQDARSLYFSLDVRRLL